MTEIHKMVSRLQRSAREWVYPTVDIISTYSERPFEKRLDLDRLAARWLSKDTPVEMRWIGNQHHN